LPRDELFTISSSNATATIDGTKPPDGSTSNLRSFVIVKKYLDDECFQIDTVENGDAALKKLRVTEYDLYLIDIRMPTMDGIEFYRQLKIELPGLLDKIVFTTGDLMKCHICGKENKSSLLKPTCYDCYKANKNKLEFPLQKT
jgi:hypothetical protein